MSRQFLTPVRLPAGNTNPSGESTGALYFNTELGTVLVFNGSDWISIGSSAGQLTYLDGGLADGFYEILDGGFYNTIEFSSSYDGGTPTSF